MNVPKIRFNGFSDEWKFYNLNSVAEYRNGKAHEKNISENGEYIVVNSKFVSTDGKVKKYSDVQISPLYIGDLAFVLSDVPNGKAIAKAYLIECNDKYTLNQRVAGLKPLENTSPYFFKNLINRHAYFLKFDDGVKQTNLTLDDVTNFEERYPSLQEQIKIGELFKTLDELIELKQEKLETTKELKKTMLSKMFPKEGHTTPEIRFNGFTGEWVNREIWDITTWDKKFNEVDNDKQENVRKYKYVSAEKISELAVEGGNIPLIECGVGKTKYTTEDIALEYLDSEEFIAIPWGGTPNVKYNKGPFVTSDNRIAKSKNNEFLNTYYLFIYMTFNISVWSKFYRGASIKHPSMKDMLNLKINIPSLQEQTKIGYYFKNLDEMITSQQKELEALKETKQLLLKKLFV